MLKNVVLNDSRNVFFFVRANHYKLGLNNNLNRLRSVSNFIEKEWLKMSKESFKMKCKINIIQVQLNLLYLTAVCKVPVKLTIVDVL
jgi:hypothetical protein